jgi:anti-sigma-K factor RskA
MSHAGFEESLDLYAIGALDREERRALDVHLLTGCQGCHAALKEAQAVVSLLPYRLPLAAPPADLKDRLLASLPQAAPATTLPKVSVQIERQPEVRLSRIVARPPWWGWLLHPLVMVLVVLAAGAYAWSLRSRLPVEIEQRSRLEATLKEQTAHLGALHRQVEEQRRLLTEVQGQVAASAGELDRLRQTLAAREAELDQARAALARAQPSGAPRKGAPREEAPAFLQSPAVKAVSLIGVERAQSVGALLLFDPDSRRAFFYAFGLPPLPNGKTYQLWAFTDKPGSAGTFRPDAGGKGRLLIKHLPDPATVIRFALSVEPAGGSPQPSSEILPLQRP